MATDRDLLAAAATKNAKRVQGGPSYSDKLPHSKNKMNLEEFMRRNPSARSKDKVKKAQEKQGKRAQPKTRETARSRRGGAAVPTNKATTNPLAARVNLIIAGARVDWLEPKKKAKGLTDDTLMDMPIEELMNQ